MFRFFTVSISDNAEFTTSVNGSAIEVTDFTRGCIFYLTASAGLGTNPTLDVKIQDSPDALVWSDVPGLTFAPIATFPTNERIPIYADKLNKFVRVSIVIGGTTPSYFLSLVAVFEERIQP